MDDAAQNNQINNQTNQQVQQDLPSLQTKPVQPEVSKTPITPSLNKEKVIGGFSEAFKPTEEEVKVEEELKNVGVAPAAEKPKLDKIHEQIGVTASAENAPVKTSSSSNITLPVSEEEIDKVLKENQIKFNLHENIEGEYTEDALPFWAALIKKIYKEIHRRIFNKTL